MHQQGGCPTLDLRLCRIAPSYPIAKAFSGRSGKVYKPDLDTISSKTIHPLTTSHQQCTIQIYLFSFAVMLSMFFSAAVRKTGTFWEQQLAHAPEGVESFFTELKRSLGSCLLQRHMAVTSVQRCC